MLNSLVRVSRRITPDRSFQRDEIDERQSNTAAPISRLTNESNMLSATMPNRRPTSTSLGTVPSKIQSKRGFPTRPRKGVEQIPRWPKIHDTVVGSSCSQRNIEHDVSAVIHYRPSQVLLTLFPECFSSFAHATCSLSDFAQYLALRGAHLAIQTPFSKYHTLGVEDSRNQARCRKTGLSPSMVEPSSSFVQQVDNQSSVTHHNSIEHNTQLILTWA